MGAPTERRERTVAVGRWQVRLTSYRLEDEWVCVADNVDPGAVLCRVTAAEREEAEDFALSYARERVTRTRTFSDESPGEG